MNQQLLMWAGIALILSPISYLAWLATRKDKLDDGIGFQGGAYFSFLVAVVLFVLSFIVK